MKKEILGILVCMLFIVSVFPSSSFSLNDGPYVEITWPSDEYESSESNIIVTGFTSGELPLKEYGYIINYPDGGVFSEFWPFNPPVEYYEFEISIDLIEGLEGNMVTVYAKDTQDNQGTDSLTVYYVPEGEDNEPPEVVIIYPVDNAIFIDPEISLLGYVDDNVGMVIFTAYQIWNDEEYLIHSDVFTDPLIAYEFNFVVTLKPGLNTLKVTAYDAADNKGEDIVNVTKDYECGHKTPTITDNSGNTTFYGLFIGINYQYQDSEIFGPENNARTLAAHLLEKPGWDEENIRILTADNASGFWIETYLRWAKANAQPGDEFLFHFSGHGGNDSIGEGSHPDELTIQTFHGVMMNIYMLLMVFIVMMF